ncbi:MAG TPA: serine/threonine-protein kinase [Polyangiaceae bacterium]|jgi:serine/threonine-protein kinase
MSSQELGTSATVALDTTTVDPNLTLAAPVSLGVNTSLRTTVLPRVEIVGEEQKVVADGKIRYELARRLGEGGVGEVVMARDNDIERDVAIKRLRPELQGSHASILRFAEEVRTVGRLEHPNIVPIHDVGIHANGEYFFVMKYVEGETLEAIIDKLAAGDAEYHRRYPFERRVEIMMGILEAVAYAHSKHIIHRDIKPANVMVGPYGEVVVMDWGLAREVRGPEPLDRSASSPDASGKRLWQTQLGALLGTPAYMSPEQARGDELDERSDVYSLSVMFYELLTLRHPHAEVQTLDAMLDAVKSTPAAFAVMVAHPVQGPAPIDLAWFLEKGLKKNSAERYQNVQEMIERLQRRAAGDIPIQCPTTFSIRMTTLMRRALSRRPFLMPAIFLLATLGMTGLAAVGVFAMVR